MRTAILTIVAFLLIGAALLTLWPAAAATLSQTPPGQYPLQQSRWQWPVTVREAPYHPRKGMGTNTVAFTDPPAQKLTCAVQ